METTFCTNPLIKEQRVLLREVVKPYSIIFPKHRRYCKERITRVGETSWRHLRMLPDLQGRRSRDQGGIIGSKREAVHRHLLMDST